VAICGALTISLVGYVVNCRASLRDAKAVGGKLTDISWKRTAGAVISAVAARRNDWLTRKPTTKRTQSRPPSG
jgi:hypothetical protein